MTAILRAGGEYNPGSYLLMRHVESAIDEDSTSLIAGRTGGRAYHVVRESSTPIELFVESDVEIPDGMTVAARTYFKFNQNPNNAGGAAGMTFMVLRLKWSFGGDSGNVDSTAFLTNDGKLRWSPSVGSGGSLAVTDTPDLDDPLPTGEWIMVELLNTYASEASGEKLRRALRVTVDGEDPRMVYFRGCTDGALEEPTGPITAQLLFGMLSDGGDGLEIDFDDLGINLCDDGPHNTWCGPGEVRMAKPVSSTAADVFEQGLHRNTARAVEGRTIPSDAVIVSGSPEICSPQYDFEDILSRDPPTQSATSPARCVNGDDFVNSSGTDYHKAQDGPGSPTGNWAYDYPRVGSAGDQLVLTMDASDQSGALSYVMPYGIMHGSADDSDPHYFSFYGDWESAPTYADAGDKANILIQGLSSIEHRGMRGRITQSPTLGSAPELTVERQHDCSAADSTFPLWEWSMVAVGAVYESGYVEQPPLPVCSNNMTWT